MSLFLELHKDNDKWREGAKRMSEVNTNNMFRSEKRLDMLKKRTKRCVCKYCGGRLKLRRIIFSDYEDARIEIFAVIVIVLNLV